MAEQQPGEQIDRTLKTKVTYKWVNPQLGLEVPSRDVWKNGTKVIHFPFNPRSGAPKYRQIQEIVYEDLPGNLPSGYLKAPRTGYGFTRELSPILFALQDTFPDATRIVVSGSRASQVTNRREVVLANADLQVVRPKIAALQAGQRAELETAANNELARVLPTHFTAETTKYTSGQLGNFVTSKAIRPSLLSEADLEALSTLISRLPAGHKFIKSEGLLSTKASVDRLLIEDLIASYEKLMERKTGGRDLEAKWQAFFSKNILYFNFGYVQRFEKELIQGDKKLTIPDFLLLNTFGYLDVFEIKTHLTQLLSYDTGRKNFHWHSEASKAIAQAENYYDSLVREEDRVIKNIRDEYGIAVDAVRPNLFVIASSTERIAGPNTTKLRGKTQKKLWNDFRRLNASLRNVQFILYDELLDLLNNLIQRLASEAGDEDE